jgi:hypothetical protein
MKITPEQIQKHKWWWREANPAFTITPKGTTRQTDHPLGIFWKDGTEMASYRYELVRRLEKNPDSWMELSSDKIFALKARLSESSKYWVQKTGGEPEKIELENPHYTEPILFNLDCSDSMLVENFKEFIKEQRVIKRVKHPVIIRKNAVSWRWLEVWDLNEFDQIPLNPSEHSMKSKAIKMAGEYKSEVERALKESENVKNTPYAKVWASKY